MIKRWLAPLCFALFPTLVIYAHNIDQVSTGRIVVPLLYSVALAVLSGAVAVAIFRNQTKASVFTVVWLILFFSYGYVYLKLGTVPQVALLPLSLNKLLLVSYGACLVLLGWLLKRNTTLANHGLQVATLVGVVLVGFNLAQIVPFELHRRASAQRLQRVVSSSLAPVTIDPDSAPLRPDIYYIIFDRYARADVLEKYFDYDNSAFTQQLADDGFLVASESYANYPNTFLSLSSSLNFEPLDFLSNELGTEADRIGVYNQLIEHNRITKTLANAGYRTRVMGSFWDPTKYRGGYDDNQNLFADFDEFQLFIYERTLLNTVRGMVEDKQLYTGVERLKRMSLNLDYRLSSVRPTTDQPQFVFMHLLMPHEPNIFAEDCRPLTFDEIRAQSLDDAYLRELQCANTVMARVIDQVTDTGRPSVIIFQSDEGPYLPEKYFGHTDYVYPESPEALAIHSAILNAIYLPDKTNPTKAALYADLGLTTSASPVNTFRAILNYYFDADLPLYENTTNYFTDEHRPYDFIDVTDQLPRD